MRRAARVAEVARVVDQPIALATGVDRDAHLPERCLAPHVDLECAVLRDVAECRRMAGGERFRRRGRRDLAQQLQHLRIGQWRLRHRARRAGDLQLGERTLIEAQGGRAMADHR